MSRVGNVYADLAIQFAKRFPIGTTLSVKMFDSWGMDQEELDPIDQYDAMPRTAPEWAKLLGARNDLRRRINKGAASEAFRSKPSYPPFSVDVNEHGESYVVRDSANSYEIMARRLPTDLDRVATTKRQRIEGLLHSIDFEQLPANAQLLVHQLDRHIKMLMKDVGRRLDDFNENFAEVEGLIKKLDLKPRNSGLISFVTEEDDDDEP